MLQVGEVARQLNLNTQTLYFYERVGSQTLHGELSKLVQRCQNNLDVVDQECVVLDQHQSSVCRLTSVGDNS
ncbi:hypothetical protein K4A83_19440 [Spirulina subsalsa FACHB-351]|uniref:HTH merR-type domain-containing protein n=1 Tax=Spirulina subsalsa FACHB-351 TaxID=234711 RepID=A0ABT3LAA6_9CYAN|nr:hypothetical protein [Spirulina subsalsa]MCW6038430.1 hypothetical protein [Spirulina subsalsa FACHB-351]